MNQEEFLTALSAKQRAIDVYQKHIDNVKKSMDRIYEERSKTIAQALDLKTNYLYQIKYKANVKDGIKDLTKSGYFYCVEHNKQKDNFTIRLTGVKKDGSPCKNPEASSEAVLITDITNIQVIK